MPHFLGLNLIDAIVVAISLTAVLAIGVIVSRSVRGENEFFVSGRNMGPWLQFFLNFGQATDSNGAPTIATEVYRQGVGGMWIGFQTLFITPFIWFTCIWFRRARVITGPDLFIARFNSRALATLFAWYTALLVPINLGLGNIISYKVAAAMMVKSPAIYTADEQQRVAAFEEYRSLKSTKEAGSLSPTQLHRYQILDSMAKRGQISSSISYISPLGFYLVYTGIVAAYIMLGGIKAAAVTDAFQGLLIIIFSVMMIPLGLHAVGGFQALHDKVPAHKFLLFGSEAMSEYTWYSIAAIVFASLVTFGNPAGPAVAAARDERALRTGLLGGVFLKRFVMIAWMFCGLLALALIPGGVSDPDKVWGELASRLLVPGLMGMMISGMLLGHMPAVGVAAVNFSATFTRNLYEPAVQGQSPAHYLFVAKAAIAGVLGLGVLFALFFSGVIELLSALITFTTYFGATGFLIYFWRRLTGSAVAIGAVVWLVMMTVVAWGLPQYPAFRQLPLLVQQTNPQIVTVKAPATEMDVSAGNAGAVGEIISKKHTNDPRSMFFDRVARIEPNNPNSPLEGLGRFHVENFVLYMLGAPLPSFGPAGLLTCRWMFSGVFPFLLLITLSHLSRGVIRRPSHDPSFTDDEGSTFRSVGDGSGTTLLEATPARTAVDVESLRIARFYARLKTPVHADPAIDANEVALSDVNPKRFDHLKLFPRSQWEFARWDRADYLGFFGCWAGVGLILMFLWGLLQIGA